MLTGKELGEAIAAAIKMKGVSQRALAAHFGVKPPSVQDWIKRGTIGKDKLPGLWDYFSDVVGPDHWGLGGSMLPGLEASSAGYVDSAPAQDPGVTATGHGHSVNESDWALLEDFKMLPDDEKAALRATLKGKADHVRKIVAEYLGRQGLSSTPATNQRVEETFGVPPPSPVSTYRKITPVPAPAAPSRKGVK